MSEKKPASPAVLSATMFLIAGIAFLVTGVTFLLTGNGAGLWITFLALGLVFIVLSTTQRAAAAKVDAPPADDTPPS